MTVQARALEGGAAGVGIIPYPVPAELEDRLWQKVEPEPNTGCHLWTGYVRNGMHGSLWYGPERTGKNIYVHQLAYVLRFGPIPLGKVVCHRCDVGICTRWEHFFLGTKSINTRDMLAKGRNVPPPRIVGESHPFARLTDATVSAIRARAAVGGLSHREIALLHNTSRSNVQKIVSRTSRAAS